MNAYFHPFVATNKHMATSKLLPTRKTLRVLSLNTGAMNKLTNDRYFRSSEIACYRVNLAKERVVNIALLATLAAQRGNQYILKRFDLQVGGWKTRCQGGNEPLSDILKYINLVLKLFELLLVAWRNCIYISASIYIL